MSVSQLIDNSKPCSQTCLHEQKSHEILRKLLSRVQRDCVHKLKLMQTFAMFASGCKSPSWITKRPLIFWKYHLWILDCIPGPHPLMRFITGHKSDPDLGSRAVTLIASQHCFLCHVLCRAVQSMLASSVLERMTHIQGTLLTSGAGTWRSCRLVLPWFQINWWIVWFVFLKCWVSIFNTSKDFAMVVGLFASWHPIHPLMQQPTRG